MTAFKSKWLIVSSSINKVGSKYKALANDTHIVLPPEKFLDAPFCITLLNTKPARILRAVGSAESAPIKFNYLLIFIEQ